MKKVDQKTLKTWKIRFGVLSEVREAQIEGLSLTNALTMYWSDHWASFRSSDLSFKIDFIHKNKEDIIEIWCKIVKNGEVSERYQNRHRIIEVLEGEIPKNVSFIEELTPEFEAERYKGPVG
jgi:hypothetical protein